MYSSAYVWAKILGQLEQKLTSITVSTYFDDVEVVELTDTKLVLYTPSHYRKENILRSFTDHIKTVMQDLFNTTVELVVLDESEIDAYRNQPKNPSLLDFNPQFTFDHFVVGSTNRMAYSAALRVAENPAESYNPLFLYGPSGLGKTHLLYAIANKIHKDHPDYHIVYIKGDDFTNELVSAVREGRNIEFRSKYRSADLFLVDDIQFIAGKDSTQEEFFHTFNTLHESHRQIVLTADRPPNEMNLLEERLRTRFEGGLMQEIQPPDYTTRMAIIKNKAIGLGMDMPDDVCNYIAENITSNVRQIEGTVKKIHAYYDMDDMELTVNNVARAIKDMHMNPSEALPTPALVIAEVARYYNLQETVLRGTLRSKNVAEARQIAMYLMRSLINLSFPDIGREFVRDHTTVMYSCEKVKETLQDPTCALRENIRDITANINNKLAY